MGSSTLLGQWGHAIDKMFEAENIITTNVLVDQMYQELVPAPGVRSSAPLVVPSYVAEAVISPVDARDIAKLLGNILLGEAPKVPSNIVVPGPAPLSYSQIAQIMSRTLDIPLTFSPHGPQNAALREMFEVFKTKGGEKKHNIENIESIIGKSLCTFEIFLNDCILKR